MINQTTGQRANDKIEKIFHLVEKRSASFFRGEAWVWGGYLEIKRMGIVHEKNKQLCFYSQKGRKQIM